MIRASSISQLPGFGLTRIAVTCGVYDGLHRGHQAVLELLLRYSRESNAAAVMITFDPHPRAVLTPTSQPKLLLSQRHKLHLLEQMGLDAVVVMPFTRALARLDPAAFVDTMIRGDNMTVAGFCVSEAWRFGHRAQGDADVLRELGRRHGFDVVAAPTTHIDGEPVSSTRIRTALFAGRLDVVRQLLGRNHSIMESVGFGKGIATTHLQCPTANLICSHEAYPPHGVYAARVRVVNDGRYVRDCTGVLYIGNSPTFLTDPPDNPSIEIHIFDFSDDIYGALVEVEIIEFLRDDQKFDGIPALRRQIDHDVAAAKAALVRAALS